MTFQFSFRLVAKSNFDLLLRKWAPKTTKFKASKNVKIDSLYMMLDSNRLAIGTTNYSIHRIISQTKKIHRTVHYLDDKRIFFESLT